MIAEGCVKNSFSCTLLLYKKSDGSVVMTHSV